MVLYLMAVDLVDICAVLHLSSSEMFGYWPLLNIIGWISIVLGFTSIVMWGLCIFAVRHPAVQFPARSCTPISIEACGLETLLLRFGTEPCRTRRWSRTSCPSMLIGWNHFGKQHA